MINAELLSDIQKARHTPFGDEVRIAHIQTKHGITAVRSVVPHNARKEAYVAGGLGSGAVYDRFVNRAAQAGFLTRTVRYASNGINGAIEADAEELTASIEQLAQGPTHIFAHSKGGRVAIKAAAQLDSSIDLRSITLVNPALERSRVNLSPDALLGVVTEQIACFGKLKNAARGVFHEITHRGLGLLGEIRELMQDDPTIRTSFETLAERGIHTTIVGGSFDHIVPYQNITASAQHMHFDEVHTAIGRIEGSHFGILASDAFADSILPHAS